MTLIGAIKQLHELRSAEDMPIYYKPVIAEVINVLLMDTQEVRHGRWITDGAVEKCNLCGEVKIFPHWIACPGCGAKMNGEEE